MWYIDPLFINKCTGTHTEIAYLCTLLRPTCVLIKYGIDIEYHKSFMSSDALTVEVTCAKVYIILVAERFYLNKTVCKYSKSLICLLFRYLKLEIVIVSSYNKRKPQTIQMMKRTYI